MIARDYDLIQSCRIMRYWFRFVEEAELLDPSLTPYVQAARQRAWKKAGLIPQREGLFSKDGMFMDFVLLAEIDPKVLRGLAQ